MPLFGCGGETTGLRRRWIAWPRDKNRDDPYEAHAPLLHISRCLPPVLAEAASCLDVKASLLKFLLPRETRHLFRCRVEDGTLEELARPPVGYKASPEILQITITSAIAGGDDGGSPPLGCTSIGACRRLDRQYTHCRAEKRCDIVGSQVLRNAAGCHATMGGSRIGRCAVHLSGGAVWSCSPDGVTE
ncbi:hypothetical protein C3747_369g18 [Trypanosoma cruzi]|uniref:Uncharacterized protein n=1 Tax=Trypanosoma cruzi TaxID=5693 RepID=A0A2V2V217_TRYCR|nr:hypothetical protein C3747_369g18 [Trypanosoma cruzi]